MAIQKHNTYYDNKKPGSGIYYYDENGNHKEVLTRNDLNAISSISSINDKVIALSSKTVSEIKSTDTVTATPHTATDGTIYYKLQAAPAVSDTIINGENGISSTNQGTIWTIGLSADYLSANALNNLSGNWQNTYSAVSSNSATWKTVTDKVDTTSFTPVKNDVDTLKANSAHSTLSSKNDYIKVTKDGVNYGVEFISGDLTTKTWVNTNYQEKGNYLSANALDNLSGNWQSTNNTVKTYSGDWQEVNKKLYTSAFETISGEWSFSADVDKRLENTSAWANSTFQPIGDYLSANALDKIKETSAKWDSTYSSVYSNSANWDATYERVELSGNEWDKVSAKLDSSVFTSYSSQMEQNLNDLDDKNLDTTAFNAWSAQTTDWDVTKYSDGNGISIDEHVISITADYLSANSLDKIKATSANWDSTYNTVETNSGKLETAYETLTTYSADWDEVSAKLNSATFATYSAYIKSTIETFSGEFVDLSGDFTAHSANNDLHLSTGERIKWTSATNRVENSAAIWDNVSAKVNKTEFEEFKTSAHNELEKKLDKNTFESWSANKDYDFYSAGKGIKIENHIVSVSANYALSADVDTCLTNYYNKTQVDEKFADFGGFVVVSELPTSGDNKKIYLINDPSSPEPDQYKEYIYTENVWKCIGDTSVDLTQYYKKTETSAAEDISTEFTNTSAWANDTFQPIGNYVTSGNYITQGPAWVLVNDNNGIHWSGLDVSELGKKYIVTSTNNTVYVGSAQDGNTITYNLSANVPSIPGISGYNGLSGYYNSTNNKYYIGIDGDFYSASNPSGFINSAQAESQILAKKYITSSVGELDNFYSKSQTSGAEEIANAIKDFVDIDLLETTSGALKTWVSTNYYDKTDTSSKTELQTKFGNLEDTKLEISAAAQIYQPKGDYLSANALNSLSGKWETVEDKLDTTVFSEVSGTFLTAHQSLDDYATKVSLESTSAEITAMIPTDLFTQASADTLYQPIGDYYSATNPSGFIDGLVVLDYGVSTWQDFYDAYKKNKVILCRVQSGVTGYRHGFVAWIDGTPNNPTQVQFQYYRNVNPHKSNQQVDEIYIYTLKPNTEPAWTTSKRNTGTQIVAGAGLSSKFEASPCEITLSVSADYATSSNLVANNQYTLTTTGWSAVTIPDTLSAGSGVEIVSNGINALLGTDLAFNSTTSAIQINTNGSAYGSHAFVEGTNTTASGNGTHAEGADAGAYGQGAHAGGYGTHTTGVGNFIHGTFLNFASPDGTSVNNTPVFVGGTLNATSAQDYTDHGGYLQIMGNGTYVGAGQGNNSDAYILYRDGTVSAKQFQNADGTETINGTTYNFSGVDNIEILPSGAIADTVNFPNDNVLRFILES